MSYQDIVSLISLSGVIVAIIFTFRNNRRSEDQQTREDAGRLARIEGKLDSANRGIDDVRVEVRLHGSQLAELGTRVTRVEESVKSAHRRIDGIERSGEHE